jgi:hypothetical protein
MIFIKKGMFEILGIEINLNTKADQQSLLTCPDRKKKLLFCAYSSLRLFLDNHHSFLVESIIF